MKQTSVEWLGDQIDNLLELYPSERQGLNKAIQQAKEMEKQQIIEAFKRGTINEMNGIEEITSEQYYNETFNK